MTTRPDFGPGPPGERLPPVGPTEPQRYQAMMDAHRDHRQAHKAHYWRDAYGNPAADHPYHWAEWDYWATGGGRYVDRLRKEPFYDATQPFVGDHLGPLALPILWALLTLRERIEHWHEVVPDPADREAIYIARRGIWRGFNFYDGTYRYPGVGGVRYIGRGGGYVWERYRFDERHPGSVLWRADGTRFQVEGVATELADPWTLYG